jgi:hypothetical protein
MFRCGDHSVGREERNIELAQRGINDYQPLVNRIRRKIDS